MPCIYFGHRTRSKLVLASISAAAPALSCHVMYQASRQTLTLRNYSRPASINHTTLKWHRPCIGVPIAIHENTEYRYCENVNSKAAASGKAKEEAATDAMKWPLRNFGKVVGDCPYDKDYLSRTTKAKCNPQSEVVSIHPFSYRCSAQQLLKLMIAQEVGPILAACGLQVIVLYSRHHLRNRPQ